ncbi:MAG: HEAT repeat domain-containing protein [Bacteroidetes bacterium]|nr:HEAT repeat domain-containing protein [Bacteroidota bacterium]
MKTLFKLTVLVLFLTFISIPINAKLLPADSSVKVTKSRIVDNLLVGIKSQNEGLKLSSLFQLGNYAMDKAVIELMRTLKDDSKAEARITAALSLYKLGDPRGLFAIGRAAIFDESPRVRKMCEKYYQQSVLAHYN